MSESQSVHDLLAKAESAAAAGDLASAEALLHAIARIQEGELGDTHPDLANTFNNLAIVAERTGRPADAEKYYRRAVAIASASLPVDDPMVAASRQNLEEFCRAQGLPIDVPASRDLPDTPQPPVTTPTSDPRPSSSTASASTSAFRPMLSFARVAVAIVALLAAALFVVRPWSSRVTSTPAPEPGPAAQSAPAAPPRPQKPEQAQPAAPALLEPASPPPTRADSSRSAIPKPRAPARAAGAVTLVAAQLCRTLSTSGAWRCAPAGDSVPPGVVVLYTRVKSPRDTIVVHHWYRGGTLRRSVQLPIRASASEGYRTFSRQTVDRGEDWRVEVRSAAGDLLHEQHLKVR